MNKTRAFTLVELLLCIAIVALLIGLISPSLTRLKQRAMSVGCAANLKKMVVAVHSAANDNNDTYPYIQAFEDIGTTEYPEGTPTVTMYEALTPYGVTERDLKCPSDTEPPAAGKTYTLSYAWNPVAAGEPEVNVRIYGGRRGVYTAKLTRLRLFEDIRNNHYGAKNVVFANGNVTIR